MMKTKPHRRRHGMLLIVVLACLAVVSTVSISMLTSTVRMHRDSRHAFQLRQAQLLIDSAISRARVVRRERGSEFKETWTPEFPDRQMTADVVIESTDDKLSINVTLLSASGFRVKRSDQISFPTELP